MSKAKVYLHSIPMSDVRFPVAKALADILEGIEKGVIPDWAVDNAYEVLKGVKK